MKNYLEHLHNVGDTPLSFMRKFGYIDYNFGKFVSTSQKLSVLEIGPGTGALISYLNSKNITQIDIIDNDPSIIAYIKKNFRINNSFKTEDISRISSKLRTYDLIFMLQVFEHIPKSQYKTVISTLVRKLKPGGKIVIMVPNGANPLNLLERYHDIQHVASFTEDSLRELPSYCDISGVLIDIEPYRIPPNSPINIFRIILQKILHLFIVLLIVINGGVYQFIMTPNITLIISKK